MKHVMQKNTIMGIHVKFVQKTKSFIPGNRRKSIFDTVISGITWTVEGQ